MTDTVSISILIHVIFYISTRAEREVEAVHNQLPPKWVNTNAIDPPATSPKLANIAIENPATSFLNPSTDSGAKTYRDEFPKPLVIAKSPMFTKQKATLLVNS